MARVELPIVVINSSTGLPVNGASVAIAFRSTGAPATWYTAETGGTASTAAVITDANGRATAWLPRGAYNCTVTGTGITPYTEPWDAVPGADQALDTLWVADGAITNAKLASGIDAGKLTTGTLPAARLPASGVGATQLADGIVTFAKMVNGENHLAYNTWGAGGSATQIPANTTTNIVTKTFVARTTEVVIVGFCYFREIRGGSGSGTIYTGISGGSTGSNFWDVSGGFGGFGLAVANIGGLTAGVTYTACTGAAVANNPITLQANGDAYVLVFDCK